MGFDNPAGRLHKLLLDAGVPPKASDESKVRVRWAEVLGIEPEDHPTLLARLSKVLALPPQVRVAVEDVPEEEKDDFLAPLPYIETAFVTLNLDQPWKNFGRPITPDVMTGLGFCDWLLRKHKTEPHLPDEERERIHKEVRDLFEDVRANEDDDDLRKFLLRHLKAMDDALQEYKISGAPPVEEAIHAAMGDGVIRRLRGETPPRNSRSDRFWRMISRLAITLNLFTTGVELPETVSSAFASIEEAVVAESDAESGEQTESEGEEG